MTTCAPPKETPLLVKVKLAKDICTGVKTETRRFEKLGEVGDRLWVRTSWYHNEKLGQAWDEVTRTLRWKTGQSHVNCDPVLDPKTWRKRPSMHMYRWASGILLEILAVRRERLHDITEDGSKAEAARIPATKGEDGKIHLLINLTSPYLVKPGTRGEPIEKHYYRNQFAALWEECYGSGSWRKNPMVWVHKFRKLENP